MSRWPVAGPFEYWLLTSSPASKVKKKSNTHIVQQIHIRWQHTQDNYNNTQLQQYTLPTTITHNTTCNVMEVNKWAVTGISLCEILRLIWVTRRRSWLRHRASSRNVAGPIPDGVIGIFYWRNPSDRSMASGSTLRLTQMSSRNIAWWGKDGRCVGLATLPLPCADCSEIR